MAILSEAPTATETRPFRQDCPNRRVAVLVDDTGGFTEIPTTKVNTYVSKEGVSDKNTVTEFEFPAEWYGEDVANYITALDNESQSHYDTAVIKYTDPTTGEWYDVHYGYVRAVKGTRDNVTLRAWVGDPAEFTTAIPVNVNYGTDTTIVDVFTDVAEKMEEYTIFDNIRVADLENKQITGDSLNPFELVLRANFGYTKSGGPPRARKTLKTGRNFRGNRHTLSDVLEWVTNITGGKWYFEYTSVGVTLVHEPDVNQFTYIAQNVEPGVDSNTGVLTIQGRHIESGESGSIRVLQNDALHEIMPISALTIQGQSQQSISGLKKGKVSLNGRWPVATARYDPLYERTGQSLAPPVRDADTVTLDATENVAISQLKSIMMGSSSGDIELVGSPPIEPYDRIFAKPLCDETFDATIPPLEYEVQRIEHEKVAEKEFRTRAIVSLFVDESNITVKSYMSTNDTEVSPAVREANEDIADATGIAF